MKHLILFFFISEITTANQLLQLPITEIILTVCTDKNTNKFQINLPDINLTMQRPNDGVQNTQITQVVATPFTKSDFKPQDLETIFKYARISNFNSGINYQGVTEIENEKVNFLVFEYGKSQKSVLMFLQGWPIPFGRTEDCPKLSISGEESQ